MKTDPDSGGLKTRPGPDPQHWFWQIAPHGVHAVLSRNGKNRDSTSEEVKSLIFAVSSFELLLWIIYYGTFA